MQWSVRCVNRLTLTWPPEILVQRLRKHNQELDLNLDMMG